LFLYELCKSLLTTEAEREADAGLVRVTVAFSFTQILCCPWICSVAQMLHTVCLGQRPDPKKTVMCRGVTLSSVLAVYCCLLATGLGSVLFVLPGLAIWFLVQHTWALRSLYPEDLPIPTIRRAIALSLADPFHSCALFACDLVFLMMLAGSGWLLVLVVPALPFVACYRMLMLHRLAGYQNMTPMTSASPEV
ncbi:hypothetical protein KIPB_006322, partial [Kipferlia bialata]